jgi:hypothetical protein
MMIARNPPGWAEAFRRAAVLAGADDVRRDLLVQIVLEEFPPSEERSALLARLERLKEGSHA